MLYVGAVAKLVVQVKVAVVLLVLFDATGPPQSVVVVLLVKLTVPLGVEPPVTVAVKVTFVDTVCGLAELFNFVVDAVWLAPHAGKLFVDPIQQIVFGF